MAVGSRPTFKSIMFPNRANNIKSNAKPYNNLLTNGPRNDSYNELAGNQFKYWHFSNRFLRVSLVLNVDVEFICIFIDSLSTRFALISQNSFFFFFSLLVHHFQSQWILLISHDFVKCDKNTSQPKLADWLTRRQANVFESIFLLYDTITYSERTNQYICYI